LNDTRAVTVLVVDDDSMVLEIYRLILERAGFNVLVAGDGLVALEVVSSTPPDLILLDIKMPRMDGIEVLKRLAADQATSAIPVVMLSNFDDPALITESRRLGAKQYCIKANLNPAKELTELVRTWVR
jgi:CheY-like chemotaxis protein